MAKPTRAHRLANLLRRNANAEGERAPERDRLAPAFAGAAWSAHGLAMRKARAAAEAAQAIASHVAKQRVAADALHDRLQAATAKADELAAGFGRVTDSFERLGLVALNAGLEGARLGEIQGRSLLLVSDEVRSHVARGSESARELTSTLGEVAGEVNKLQVFVDQLRQGAQEASQEASRVATAAQEGERSIAELGARLQEATGSDPETAELVGQASDHAKALVVALGALGGKAPPNLILGALRPVLGPLARLLGDQSAVPDDADENPI